MSTLSANSFVFATQESSLTAQLSTEFGDYILNPESEPITTETVTPQIYGRPKGTTVASMRLINSRVDSAIADAVQQLSIAREEAKKSKVRLAKGTLSAQIDASKAKFDVSSVPV